MRRDLHNLSIRPSQEKGAGGEAYDLQCFWPESVDKESVS